MKAPSSNDKGKVKLLTVFHNHQTIYHQVLAALILSMYAIAVTLCNTVTDNIGNDSIVVMSVMMINNCLLLTEGAALFALAFMSSNSIKREGLYGLLEKISVVHVSIYSGWLLMCFNAYATPLAVKEGVGETSVYPLICTLAVMMLAVVTMIVNNCSGRKERYNMLYHSFKNIEGNVKGSIDDLHDRFVALVNRYALQTFFTFALFGSTIVAIDCLFFIIFNASDSFVMVSSSGLGIAIIVMASVLIMELILFAVKLSRYNNAMDKAMNETVVIHTNNSGLEKSGIDICSPVGDAEKSLDKQTMRTCLFVLVSVLFASSCHRFGSLVLPADAMQDIKLAWVICGPLSLTLCFLCVKKYLSATNK